MLNFLSEDQLAQKTEYEINLSDMDDIIHTLVRRVTYLEGSVRNLESENFKLREELNKTINFSNTEKNIFHSKK